MRISALFDHTSHLYRTIPLLRRILTSYGFNLLSLLSHFALRRLRLWDPFLRSGIPFYHIFVGSFFSSTRWARLYRFPIPFWFLFFGRFNLRARCVSRCGGLSRLFRMFKSYTFGAPLFIYLHTTPFCVHTPKRRGGAREG